MKALDDIRKNAETPVKDVSALWGFRILAALSRARRLRQDLKKVLARHDRLEAKVKRQQAEINALKAELNRVKKGCDLSCAFWMDAD